MRTSSPELAARLDRLVAPVATVAVLGTATLALHLRDPHHQTWVTCPTYALFGVYCPGCGGLRAVNDLGNGHLVAAAHSNLLFVASLPLIAGLFAYWVARSWRGSSSRLPESVRVKSIWIYLGVALVFTVVRNLPIGAALVP